MGTTDSDRIMRREEAAELRGLLRERGLTQADLAIKAGMWPTQLSGILNGHAFVTPERRAQLDAEVKRLREGTEA